MANQTTLIIKPLPAPEMAFLNSCFSNIFIEEPALIQFVDINVVYPVYKTNAYALDKGSLYMSDVIRNHHCIKSDFPLVTKLYNPDLSKNDLKSLKLSIFKRKEVRSTKQYNPTKSDIIGIINIHERDLISIIKNSLDRHYFYTNQACLITVNGQNYTLIVNDTTIGEGPISKNTKISIETSDFEINLISSRLLKPELFRDNYKFENIGIGGLEKEMISIFREALCTRACRPEIIKKLGISQIKGILLFGPPGTGKTLIARNISTLISPVTPIIVNGPELLNKYVGDSEANIRKLFVNAENDYRKNGSSSMLHVIVFDEIDAICKTRSGGSVGRDVTDSMVNQLLTKIDGYEMLPNIFIIAMTNRKDLIDPALLRPGRIEKHIKVGFPGKEGREEIFRIHTKTMKVNGMLADDVNLNICAELTENFSGAEIASVVKNAASFNLHSLLQDVNTNDIDEENIIITMENMLTAINVVESSLNNTYRGLIDYLPDEFKILNESYGLALNAIMNFINYDNMTNRIRSLMLYGGNKSGKSTLMTNIACLKKIKCTKYIRAIDVIKLYEQDRGNRLIDEFIEMQLGAQSLLIIDDIDIIMNYSKYGSSIDYSRVIFQALKTILKTIPKNKNNKIIVVFVCSELNVQIMMEDLFDQVIII